MSILESTELREWIEQNLRVEEDPSIFVRALGNKLDLTSDQTSIYLNPLFDELESTGNSEIESQKVLQSLKGDMRTCRVLPMFLGNLTADRGALEALTRELLDRYDLEYSIFDVLTDQTPDVRAWGGVPWTVRLTDTRGDQLDIIVVHTPSISRQSVKETIFWQLFEHEGGSKTDLS